MSVGVEGMGACGALIMMLVEVLSGDELAASSAGFLSATTSAASCCIAAPGAPMLGTTNWDSLLRLLGGTRGGLQALAAAVAADTEDEAAVALSSFAAAKKLRYPHKGSGMSQRATR